MSAIKGVPLSDEHKRKISESHLGIHPSDATRRKMSLTSPKPFLGKHHSIETREQIRKKLKGIPLTEERRKNMSMARKRNKSHFWKGGITPLSVQIRNCFEYRLWRSDIFTRDKFACVICGKRGGYLEVDHYPIKFSEIIQNNHIQSLEQAIACQEFWNINNGRTICKDCHIKTKKRTTKTIRPYGRNSGRPR